MNSSKQHQKSAELLTLLQEKLASHLRNPRLELGDAVVDLDRKEILEVFRVLKIDSQLQFNLLVDITVVDWLDARPERFEMVYHRGSLPFGYRLRLKAPVPEQDAEVDSLTSLYAGANFMEREAWDMYGVRFRGHPDLRRILMYDEFKGHPLRKDYPVQAKQPRVQLRYPEVRNTAVDMRRPELVTINPRRAGAAAAPRDR